MDPCSVPGCEKPAKSRGWCQMHYMRWWTKGDVGPPHRLKSEGETPEQRFWSYVPNGLSKKTCWLWQGALRPNGYGRLSMGSSNVAAHRFAYELLVGPIPEGLELDHLCRVPSCVNPAHLEPVTHAENMRRRGPHHVNRLKTHCPQGHPYDEANTYVAKNGSRACKTCLRDRSREYQRKKRAAR